MKTEEIKEWKKEGIKTREMWKLSYTDKTGRGVDLETYHLPLEIIYLCQ